MNQFPQSPEYDTEVSQPKPVIRHGWIRGLIFLPVNYIGVTLLAVVILILIGHNLYDMTNYARFLDQPNMIILNVAMLLWTILVAFGFRRLIDNRSFVSLGFEFSRRWAKELAVGFMLGVILMTVLFLIALLVGAVKITGWHFPVGTIVVMTINLFCAAAVEEIVLRGYVLNNFMESMNKYLALVLTSVIFSVAHGFNPNVGLISLLNIVLAGLLLGIYYVHRKNLWFPIGLHFSWNLFQGAVYGSPVSGVQLNSICMTEYGGSDFLTGGQFGFEASLAASIITIGAALIIHFNYRRIQSKRD